MTLTINQRPLSPISIIPGDVSQLWDINDTILPKNAEIGPFDDWCDGHCRRIYDELDEDARKHTSGWAMRNTNNHNVSILKKSCLGVFMCSKRCTLTNGDIVRIRPAICDKARRKQLSKQCPGPKCSGRLELVPCRGHCGYPVTHFWRHYQGKIFFQSKGTHSHPQPELKSSAETRRHIQNCNAFGQYTTSSKGRLHRKRPYTTTDRSYATSPKKPTTVNEVICSCPPFEHSCTHTTYSSLPFTTSSYTHSDVLASSLYSQTPLCSLTFKMEYNNNPLYSSHSGPIESTSAGYSPTYSANTHETQFFTHDNHNQMRSPTAFVDSERLNFPNDTNILTDVFDYKNVYTDSSHMKQEGTFGQAIEDGPYRQFIIADQSQLMNNFETKMDCDALKLYPDINDTKSPSSNSLPPCDELVNLALCRGDSTRYIPPCDIIPTSSCQYANDTMPRPSSCEYDKSPVHLTELQTVTSKHHTVYPNSFPWNSNNDEFRGVHYSNSYGSEYRYQSARESTNRCHTDTSQSFDNLGGRMSSETLNSVVHQTQQIHNHNINITLKYN